MAADLAARAAAVRKRRDEMAATQEAAIQARHQLVQQNLQAGHQLKVLALWSVQQVCKGGRAQILTGGYKCLFCYVLSACQGASGYIAQD